MGASADILLEVRDRLAEARQLFEASHMAAEALHDRAQGDAMQRLIDHGLNVLRGAEKDLATHRREAA